MNNRPVSFARRELKSLSTRPPATPIHSSDARALLSPKYQRLIRGANTESLNWRRSCYRIANRPKIARGPTVRLNRT